MISRSFCFDLEIEGAIHFGKDLIRRFGNDILPLELNALEPPQNRPAVHLMAAEPQKPVLRVDNNIANKHNVEAVNDGTVSAINGILKTDRTHEIMIQPTKNPLTGIPDHEFRFDLKNKLSKNGSLKLKMLAYFIKNHLHPSPHIDSVLRNSTNNYLAKVNIYYDFISKKPIMYEIDKEFLILDMIESTNKILLNEAKRLLNYIIEESNADGSQIDVLMLMHKIENTVLEEKKDELRYVCKILKVCRPYPGYSDHLADLLSELLKLNDNSFKDIIKNFNETITIKRNFFKTIMRENVYNKISSKLITSLNHIAFMREVFSILRSVITQRHKIFKSDSLVVTVKTKAVRILLDLIDKAFDFNDDEVNYIEIKNSINSYKQWAIGERTDVGMITKKLIYNAVEILNYNWSKGTKEEVKVLTEVIFTGDTKNMDVYDNLFTKGSALIRDEEIHEHADIE